MTFDKSTIKPSRRKPQRPLHATLPPIYTGFSSSVSTCTDNFSPALRVTGNKPVGFCLNFMGLRGPGVGQQPKLVELGWVGLGGAGRWEGCGRLGKAVARQKPGPATASLVRPRPSFWETRRGPWLAWKVQAEARIRRETCAALHHRSRIDPAACVRRTQHVPRPPGVGDQPSADKVVMMQPGPSQRLRKCPDGRPFSLFFFYHALDSGWSAAIELPLTSNPPSIHPPSTPIHISCILRSSQPPECRQVAEQALMDVPGPLPIDYRPPTLGGSGELGR
ncbi:hypothetical protein EDB81DRAFT_406893 [Dactylonectria macrodidyma]|uniref:Uncharacterized protein n=1 Tax=Dactylonectria macrodidyma TaxID=307937 RepID=A0A9P9JGA1_9HYPO|nr:hypothetical protein EDB81DRAFT_406893 [Dactylonectria macrodidyma]